MYMFPAASIAIPFGLLNLAERAGPSANPMPADPAIVLTTADGVIFRILSKSETYRLPDPSIEIRVD
jgi:hypothetical protein